MDRYSEGEDFEISNVEVHSSTGDFFRIFYFFQNHGECGPIKNGRKTNGIFFLTKLYSICIYHLIASTEMFVCNSN